jgi:hypothetical protein
MAEEVIRYGAGGVPYKGGAPKPKEKKEEKPKVEVEVTETETEAETIEELEIKK